MHNATIPALSSAESLPMEKVMKNSILKPFAIIGVFAIIFAVVAPVSAQFPIKIPKIPKISKPKAPSSPTTSSSPSSAPVDISSDSSSSPSTARNENLIAGAKMYFSSTPFTNSSAGAKSSFTSADFIYGRLELNQSIYDAFGMKGFGNKDFYFLWYELEVEKNSNHEYDVSTKWDPMLITKDEAKQNFLNFDILPDPNKLTTAIGVRGVEDDLSYYRNSLPLYFQVAENNVRATFPKSGTYTLRIRLYLNNFDEWGKKQNDYEKFPSVANKFTFQFAVSDAATLDANRKVAHENAATAKNKRSTVKALPDWWGKNRGPADAKLSAARLTAFMKSRASRNDAVYLNKFAWEASSPPVWTIFKDQYGLPNYRYSPLVWAVYKNNKDGLCYYGWHSVREDYSGGGRYGQAYLSPIRDETYIDCGAIK